MSFSEIQDFSNSDEILQALEASEIENVHYAGSQVLDEMEKSIAEKYQEKLTPNQLKHLDGDAHDIKWGGWKFWEFKLTENNPLEKLNKKFFQEALKLNDRNTKLGKFISLVRWNLWGENMKEDLDKNTEDTESDLKALRKKVSKELAETYKNYDTTLHRELNNLPTPTARPTTHSTTPTETTSKSPKIDQQTPQSITLRGQTYDLQINTTTTVDPTTNQLQGLTINGIDPMPPGQEVVYKTIDKSKIFVSIGSAIGEISSFFVTTDAAGNITISTPEIKDGAREVEESISTTVNINGTETALTIKTKNTISNLDESLITFAIEDINGIPPNYEKRIIVNDDRGEQTEYLVSYSNDDEIISFTVKRENGQTKVINPRTEKNGPVIEKLHQNITETFQPTIGFKSGTAPIDIQVTKTTHKETDNLTKFQIKNITNLPTGYRSTFRFVSELKSQVVLESDEERITFDITGESDGLLTLSQAHVEDFRPTDPLSLGRNIELRSGFNARHENPAIGNITVPVGNINVTINKDNYSSNTNKIYRERLNYPGGSADVFTFANNASFGGQFYAADLPNGRDRPTGEGYVDWQNSLPASAFMHPGPFLQGNAATQTAQYEVQGEYIDANGYHPAQENPGINDVTSQGLIAIDNNGQLVFGKRSEVLSHFGASDMPGLVGKVKTAFQQIYLAGFDASGQMTFGEKVGGQAATNGSFLADLNTKSKSFHCLVEWQKDGQTRQSIMNFSDIKRGDFYGIMKSIGAKKVMYLDNFGGMEAGVYRHQGDNVDSFRTGGYIYLQGGTTS